MVNKDCCIGKLLDTSHYKISAWIGLSRTLMLICNYDAKHWDAYGCEFLMMARQV